MAELKNLSFRIAFNQTSPKENYEAKNESRADFAHGVVARFNRVRLFRGGTGADGCSAFRLHRAGLYKRRADAAKGVLRFSARDKTC